MIKTYEEILATLDLTGARRTFLWYVAGEGEPKPFHSARVKNPALSLQRTEETRTGQPLRLRSVLDLSQRRVAVAATPGEEDGLRG